MSTPPTDHIAARLCGAVDPNSRLTCLLAEDHYRFRGTKHRAVHRPSGARQGHKVMWGPGVEVVGQVPE